MPALYGSRALSFHGEVVLGFPRPATSSRHLRNLWKALVASAVRENQKELTHRAGAVLQPFKRSCPQASFGCVCFLTRPTSLKCSGR